LVDLIEQGHEIAPGTIEAVTGALDKHESPAEILEDVVWQHRNTRVAPKTVNQKQYVDSIRHHTITFAIGPAGTGKTFLAVAMAAAALSRGDVSRVILTRPAVEAGERLGFLPGDIQAKVDPYLRPLFDALYDMLDPEGVNTYFERWATSSQGWRTSTSSASAVRTSSGTSSCSGSSPPMERPRAAAAPSRTSQGATDIDLSDVPGNLRRPVGAALHAAGVSDGHIGVE